MLQDILNERSFNNNRFQILPDDLFPNQQTQSGTLLQDFQTHEDDGKSRYNSKKQTVEDLNSFFPIKEKKEKEKKKRIRKYTSNNPDNRKGHWTTDQSLKYHYFLELNAKYFIDSERRKIDKIFKSMATFIQTREPHQCRSHHQKIQKKWGSFPQILLNLRMQNFNQTKRKSLINQLQKQGFTGSYIFQDDELMNEEQLYREIVTENKCWGVCEEEHKLQSNNEASEVLINGHKPNCLCLMMSEKYEDQLSI